MREEAIPYSQPRERYVVLHGRFVVMEVALAAAVAGLSLLVWAHPGPLPGDVGIEQGIQHALVPHPWLTNPLEAVSTLNFPTPALITLAILVVVFALLRRWLDILAVVVALAVTNGSALVVSHLVHRPRPSAHGLHILAVLKTTYSFPSGHVTYAVGVFGMLLFLTYQVRQPVHPALIWAIRILLAAVILAMPVSRVLEGEHWPSDVLGGILFGAFWLALLTHGYLWARKTWPALLAPDER